MSQDLLHFAEDIVKNIVYNDEQKKLIIEVNPGLGLITLNLIKSGVSHILVFDHSEIWNLSLAQIIAKHPDIIEKRNGNMHKSLDYVLLSSLDHAEEHGFLATFVGITTSFYFLRGLVINYVKYDLWQSKFQVFLVTTTSVWDNIRKTGGQKYFKIYVNCLFHSLFNTKEIARYPRSAFLPPDKNNEEMVLIQVSTNPNFFKKIKGNELHDYFVFLRIVGAKKSNYVIPILEKWLPGCGPYLISKGISMTTQISDLSYDEVFLLYNFTKNCEGFENFKACVNHVFPRAVNIL